MRKLTDRPAVPLEAPANLEPAGAFEQADVASLAERAIDIVGRSVDPKLSSMTASKAIDYVFSNQYSDTAFEFKQNATSFTYGYDWQWLAASRYPKKTGTPSKPKILKITADTSTGRDTTDQGERTDYLIVTLQVHVVQTVNTSKYGRVPIVVRRTVQASGFKPRGGPDWWPSLRARTTAFGNTACGLYRGAILQPLSDSSDLRRDVADLRNSLDSRAMVPTDFAAKANADKLQAFVEKCS